MLVNLTIKIKQQIVCAAVLPCRCTRTGCDRLSKAAAELLNFAFSKLEEGFVLLFY